MKTPLIIVALVVLVLLAYRALAPTPGPQQARSDLPWQISITPDGGSRVLDLLLGHATLADAMAKFGALEGLAVFEPQHGEPSLEAFFGRVQLGPLVATIVVGLHASLDELAAMKLRATHREGTQSGDWKYTLADTPAQHLQRRITVISYLPGTRGLDTAFVRARFGEPSAWLRESDTAVRWFYPTKGLTILIDDDGREVFEYVPPRDIVLPANVQLGNPPAG